MLCCPVATSKPSQPRHCRNSPGVTHDEPVLAPCLLQPDTGCRNSPNQLFFPRAPAGEQLLGWHVGSSPGSSPCHPTVPLCWHLRLRCSGLAWLLCMPARCQERGKTQRRETQPARKGNHACSSKELIKICADKATGSTAREAMTCSRRRVSRQKAAGSSRVSPS